MRLFRDEVLERRADRLYGDVRLDVPLSWTLIGTVLLASVVAAGMFLGFASYAQVVAVQGSITLDRGIAPIFPSRAGIIEGLDAREGEQVSIGTVLGRIRSDDTITPGRTASDQSLAEVARQDRELDRQSQATSRAAAAAQERLAAEIRGIHAEAGSLRQQLAVQRDLIESASRELEIVREAASRGFISRRDVLQREELLLQRRQQQEQLKQALAGKEASLAAAVRSQEQTAAETDAARAALASSRADIAGRRAETEAGNRVLITAPIAGTVTAVIAHLGQRVDRDDRLLAIVPAGAQPRAELYVPTSAIGFIEPGQEVRLAIDAFPYSHFGTVPAVISTVSAAAQPRPGASNGDDPVYLVSAELGVAAVEALGRRRPLMPGMTLSARIVTRRDNLLEWIFEPLIAVIER